MEGIKLLCRQYFGRDADSITPLYGAVSTRRYFRVRNADDSFIATYSPDVNETKAFISYARHFKKLNLPVPEVFIVSEDQRFYLQQDLGNQRLHERVINRPSTALDEPLKTLYKACLESLIKLQVEGHTGLDYSFAVPRPSFDQQSILWDLNHFKYYFLKPAGIPFDEQMLEEAFISFAAYLDNQPKQAFMFRDFQTRNIMLAGETPFFIDFQGGREGAVQYDLASLLLESRAALTAEDRESLLHYYLNVYQEYESVDEDTFLQGYHGFALIRMLQVLGTYGLRGQLEKKAVFLQSISAGLENLGSMLLSDYSEHLSTPLRSALEALVERRSDYRSLPDAFDGLTVTIYSFSYRKPLPDDITGNGGGFVYDCRLLSNPGREERFRNSTGLENDVIEYLQNREDVIEFSKAVKKQLQQVFDAYLPRGYNNIMVSFGCTGGQHRSVYMASMTADWCRAISGIRVIEIHRELGIEK